MKTRTTTTRRTGIGVLAALTAMGIVACSPSDGGATEPPTSEPTTSPTQEPVTEPSSTTPPATTAPTDTADPTDTAEPTDPSAGASFDPGNLPVWQPGFSPAIEFEGTPTGFTANSEVLYEDWAPQWIGENGCEFQATAFDYETVEELENTSSEEHAVERMMGLLMFHGDDGGGRGYGLETMRQADGDALIPFVTTGGTGLDGVHLMAASTASHGPLDPGPGHSAFGIDVVYRCPADVSDMQTGWNAILETARVTMAFNPDLPESEWPQPDSVD